MESLRKKIRTYECSSLSEFLQHVATEIKQKPTGGQAELLLWRGQGDADWALHPGLQVDWEGDPEGLQTAERAMFAEFEKAAPYLFPTTIKSAWDKLSIAQHYGIRTRLLDWTVNHMVALWFALAKPADCDAAVWAFRPNQHNVATKDAYSTSPFGVDRTTVFRPMTHSQRIAMQAGWHTVHKFSNKKGGLLAIDRMDVHVPNLAILRIPSGKRRKVFGELEGAGISVTTVFGDLPSLCAFIANRHARVKRTLPRVVQK